MKNNVAATAGIATAFSMLLIGGHICRAMNTNQPVANAGPSRVIVSDASVFGDMTEAEIIAWLRAPTPASETETAKPTVQVIVIEPADDPGTVIEIPIRFNDTADMQPEWYEWVDPNLFIAQWVEWWTVEPMQPPSYWS